MPHVPQTPPTAQLNPLHFLRIVALVQQRGGVGSSPETRPTGLTIKLLGGAKQQPSARGAVVAAVLFKLPIAIGIGSLGGALAGDGVHSVSQDRFPFFIRKPQRRCIRERKIRIGRWSLWPLVTV
jgi:hypothetical protein